MSHSMVPPIPMFHDMAEEQHQQSANFNPIMIDYNYMEPDVPADSINGFSMVQGLGNQVDVSGVYIPTVEPSSAGTAIFDARPMHVSNDMLKRVSTLPVKPTNDEDFW